MRFRKKKENRVFILLLIIILLVFGNFGLFDFLKDQILTPLGPGLEKFFQKINPFQFQEKEELVKEITLLHQENQKLLAELKNLKDLKQENEYLKELNQIKSLPEGEKVLTRPLFAVESSILVLNQGKKSGIRVKDLAFNKQGFFCGWIKKTTDNFSYLKLVSGIDYKIPVRIENKEIVEGILERKNGEFWVNLVPQNKEVQTGELVLTKSFLTKEVAIPEGLLIGKIVSVEKSDLSSFQKIKISISCLPYEPFYLILLSGYE